MSVTIIGVDCATDGKRVGLALGSMEDRQAGVIAARAGSRSESIAELIARWIPEGGPTLLSVDAPLGWPVKLGEALLHHWAGMPINESPNELFRRTTDRVVKQEIGRQPLDVGADRIARTAHAALQLLQELREITGRSISLAWSPAIEGISVIEVYPAATLTAYGIQASGYKKRSQAASRRRILDSLGKHLALPSDTSVIVSNADVLDAVICILAAVDFLLGKAIEPTNRELAEKEGWIWVHRPPQIRRSCGEVEA